jgi:nucleoside-diphosphate-sugar epimerase
MIDQILITGSAGLVGSALVRTLEQRGSALVRFDLQGTGATCGDVRDRDQVIKASTGVSGIIHLAAVSRVIWGERDPESCWATNVGGVRNVLEAAARSSLRPWVIFASSREVYGQPEILPADEDTPLRPVNIYGQSKVEGERLVADARREGVRACTIRLSNVFGSIADHVDRVVPAFARGAVAGEVLRIEGDDHTFDFTYIDDVARGIASLAELLATGAAAPPPIQLVSGHPTTLAELAALAIALAGTRATVRHAPPRNFDVARFVGSGARARQLLAWQPRVEIGRASCRERVS